MTNYARANITPTGGPTLAPIGSTMPSHKSSLTNSPMTAASSSSLSTPKFQNMPSPAFRQGGRGSKQVFAALDPFANPQSKPSPGAVNTSAHTNSGTLYASNSSSLSQSLMAGVELKLDDRKYVLFNGRQSPCFARVVKEDHEGKDSILLQPLRPSFINNNLLIPWEGHLWSAKKNKTIEVKMRIHPSGELEVVSTPRIEEILNKKQSNQRFVYPIAKSNAAGGIAALDDNCDVISLESSEYEDIGDFSLFPQLATHGSNLNHRSSHVINTSLITKRLLTESMPAPHQGKPLIANSPPANHNIPKPLSGLTSTPSRTTSSSQALQKIKSSTIKLPSALVSSSKSKVSGGSIPMNPLTMTPSSSSANRRKSQEPTSASSQDYGLAPQALILPGSQGSVSKDSIAMTTVNTPQSNHNSSSQPQSQCSSVQSISQGKNSHSQFTYEELTMFASLNGFGADDVASSVASQLVEHMDQDVSQFSVPSAVQASSQSTSSSTSSLLPPSHFMRSLTPSQIVLDSHVEVSRLSIDVPDADPDGNIVLPTTSAGGANELVTPSNLTSMSTNREFTSSCHSLTRKDTPVDIAGGSVVAISISTSYRGVDCSTPMSCDDSSSQLPPVNLNRHSNSRCVSFMNPSVSPSPTSELGFESIPLSSDPIDPNISADSRISSIHSLIPSPSVVTGIAMEETENESNHSADVTTGETQHDDGVLVSVDEQNKEFVSEMSLHEEIEKEEEQNEEEKEKEDVQEEKLLPSVILETAPAIVFKEILSSEMELCDYFSLDRVVDMDIDIDVATVNYTERQNEKSVDECSADQTAVKAIDDRDEVVVEDDSADVKAVHDVNTVPTEQSESQPLPLDSNENVVNSNAGESTTEPATDVVPSSTMEEDDQVIRPPLHPQSKKRKRKSTDTNNPRNKTATAASSSSRSTRQSFPAAEPPARRARQASSSYTNKRDAFLGSWPSRKQSAASGDWRI